VQLQGAGCGVQVCKVQGSRASVQIVESQEVLGFKRRRGCWVEEHRGVEAVGRWGGVKLPQHSVLALRLAGSQLH
jgi:hypothetical protein